MQGVKGEKGDKGDKGDTGQQGIQGEQGVQGIPGETGNGIYSMRVGTDAEGNSHLYIIYTDDTETEIDLGIISSGDLEDIKKVIPSTASASNQLVTAKTRTTTSLVGALPL